MTARILTRANACLVQGQTGSWGDYGDILVHGMSAHLPRQDGQIQLERTGPFIPAMSFPGVGDIVVTDAMKKTLEASALTGVSFRPVIKARIVRIEWSAWDQDDELPNIVPKGGEPESYILANPHDPKTATDLGDLWELVPITWGAIVKEPAPPKEPNDDRDGDSFATILDRQRKRKAAGIKGPNDDKFAAIMRGEMTARVRAGDGEMPDWFRATGARYNFVSPKARSWLEDHAGDCVRFRDHGGEAK